MPNFLYKGSLNHQWGQSDGWNCPILFVFWKTLYLRSLAPAKSTGRACMEAE